MTARRILLAIALASLPASAFAQTPRAATTAADPQVRTLAGNGFAGFADGQGDRAEFVFPVAVAVDKRDGSIYVADQGAQRIRKVQPDGTVTTVAGGGDMLPTGLEVAGGYADGPGASARFNRPTGVAVGPDGAVYVADSFNHCIRKISGGYVTTYAGDPRNPGGSDGPLKEATFLEPRSIAAAADGTLYVADFSVGMRAIAPNGTVSTLGFTGSDIYGISLWESGSDSVLYAATKYTVASHNFRSNGGGGLYSTPQRFSGMSPTGVLGLGPDSAVVSSATWQTLFFAKFAGAWDPNDGFSRQLLGPDERDWQQKGGFADGPLDRADVYDPMGMALDTNGDIVLADAGNRRIRVLPAPDAAWAYSGDETLPAKPPGTYRIAIVGDAGNFSNAMAADSIAGQLRRALDEARTQNGLGDRRLEVVTVSLATSDAVAQSQYLIGRISHGSVDLVVWSLGTNALDAYPRGSATYFNDQQFVQSIFTHTAQRLNADGTRVVLAMRPVASQVAMDESTYRALLGGGIGADGSLLSFIDLEKQLASFGVPTIATGRRFADAERGPHPPLFDADYGRLAPAGNALFALTLADGLTAMRPWSASTGGAR